MKVLVEDQVLRFVATLAPEPRRMVRDAIHGLERGRGDIKELEGDLAGWCRVKAGRYRVIFRYRIDMGEQLAECAFAFRRNVSYEVFAEELRRRMKG